MFTKWSQCHFLSFFASPIIYNSFSFEDVSEERQQLSAWKFSVPFNSYVLWISRVLYKSLHEKLAVYKNYSGWGCIIKKFLLSANLFLLQGSVGRIWTSAWCDHRQDSWERNNARGPDIVECTSQKWRSETHCASRLWSFRSLFMGYFDDCLDSMVLISVQRWCRWRTLHSTLQSFIVYISEEHTFFTCLFFGWIPNKWTQQISF